MMARKPTRTFRENSNPPANQLGGEPGQSIVLAFRPAIFDADVFALNEANFVQTILEWSYDDALYAQDPDYWHRRLLRP
jgi:hypothetical protein